MASPGTSDSAPAPVPTLVVRFAPFELNLRTRELRKHGSRVRLPDQPFLILEMLLEHPGDLVTRDELRQRLWPADTFVEFDLGLNSAVRKLRDALGDSADHPTFVETVPRHGYRFIAPAHRVPPPNDVQATVPAPPVPAAPASETAAARPRRIRPWHIAATVAAAIALGVIVKTAWPSAPRIKAIAVLPFQNLTGDASRDYFVDGMTDSIITELARVGKALVISRTSSSQYKGTTKRLPEIAKELGVDAVVEGTVALADGDVQITAQLIHAGTDAHLWADRYQRHLEDVMALHEDIARAVTAVVEHGRLPPATPPASAPAVNPAAYDLFLKGLAANGRGNFEGSRIAEAYFEQAIARQSDFARAYANLALARLQFLFAGPFSPDEILPNVETAAHRALDLDSSLPDAHRALAMSRRIYGDHDGADAELAAIRRLNPARVDGTDQMVGEVARTREEALAAVERTRSRDPLSVNNRLNYARVLRTVGDNSRAIEELQAALTMAPGRANLLFQLGATHVLKGDLKPGIAALEQAVANSTQQNPRFRAFLAYAYVRDGRTGKAQQILSELLAERGRQYISSFGIALIYDALGDTAAAKIALDRAFREHALEFVQLDAYPPFPTLTADPRYAPLAARVIAR